MIDALLDSAGAATDDAACAHPESARRVVQAMGRPDAEMCVACGQEV